MSNFFTENYLNKIQTDPVMNAVFNSQQKMRSYNAVDITAWDPVARTGTTVNRGIEVSPARAGIHMYPQFSEYTHGMVNPFPPGRYQDDWGGGPGINKRYYTVYNPNLYWLNWMPQDLYNINYVNTPNPIFKSLRKTPIHISSVHQSFSS